VCSWPSLTLTIVEHTLWMVPVCHRKGPVSYTMLVSLYKSLVRWHLEYANSVLYRHTRGDMIEFYKILTDKYDNNVNLHLLRQKDSITRGHSLKLVHPRCHYDLQKCSFTVRIVNLWNSLPENVVSTSTVNTFKNRLDKFWCDHKLVYDYKADITGIGNRSLISLDETSA